MIIAVHGGAGMKRPSKKALNALRATLDLGVRLLVEGRSSLEAVTGAVAFMEDTGVFNAGAGGNLQIDGKRRLDASVMDGNSMRFGSVIGLEGIRNPVKVARLLMDLPQPMLTGLYAKRVALSHGLPRLKPPSEKELAELQRRKAHKKASEISKAYEKYFSTVGAVALDSSGAVAAGSSTGGVFMMLPGRVGDTPIIGAGTYAEGCLGAAVSTGRGEDIVRVALAREAVAGLKGSTPEESARSALKRLIRYGGQAGLLLIGSNGDVEIAHATPFMAAGFSTPKTTEVREAFRVLKG